MHWRNHRSRSINTIMGDKSTAGSMARRLEFSDLETEIKAAIVEKVGQRAIPRLFMRC